MLNKRTVIIILIVAALGASGYFLPGGVLDPADAQAVPANAAAQPARIQVTVTGAVRHPAVVNIPAGGSVKDAIQAAGGLLPEADASGIRMEESAVPSSAIHVPFQE